MEHTEMTVGDLIDLLSACDRGAPVRLAMNPFSRWHTNSPKSSKPTTGEDSRSSIWPRVRIRAVSSGLCRPRWLLP